MDKVKAQVFSIQSAIVAIGAGAAAKGMFNVAVSFETLELSLRTVTGSAEEAKKAMDWITEFTATTPYELEEVANAFKKLSAYGLAPQKYLRSLGDTAAAMAKHLDQAVEMFADATTGQFERLKEFGMRASVEGEKVTFSWLQTASRCKRPSRRQARQFLAPLGRSCRRGSLVAWSCLQADGPACGQTCAIRSRSLPRRSWTPVFSIT
jgi:phage tail tape-measure protein